MRSQVLLPCAFYFLQESKKPPVEALRRAGVPIAIATDCNPGTSPVVSPLFSRMAFANSCQRRAQADISFFT